MKPGLFAMPLHPLTRSTAQSDKEDAAKMVPAVRSVLGR